MLAQLERFLLVHMLLVDYAPRCMPMLPSLADRAWYALHCLPRDSRGKPPTARELERDYDLSVGALTQTFSGRKRHHWDATVEKVCRALEVSEEWLRGKPGAKGPTLTGILPPRPGMPWIKYGAVPGWLEAATLAQLDTRIVIPSVCYLAGADYPVLRPVERMTPELARAVSLLAYESATDEEQEKYSMQELRLAGPVPASARVRAAPLRRQSR